jgi:glycerol kinase
VAGCPYIGAIDQGTTGTRFMAFDRQGVPVARAYREHRQIYPQAGWVEHDPEEVWRNALAVTSEALAQAGIRPESIAAIGVTNQRETSLVWDAVTGKPLHNAIVWQDRRTAARCSELQQSGWAEGIRAKTGLPCDPYFSATKLEWLLQNVPGLRARAEAGRALFGTVDTWLIWKMTGAHVTDASNASRTMLFNLHTLDWDNELLALFGVPQAMLPSVRPSAEIYGSFGLGMALCKPSRHEVPVAGDLGDQQAALFGQAGFGVGDTKNTYGTGSFLLRNTGSTPVESQHGVLTTIAYWLPGSPVCYALEGSVFITGAAIQWLRDGLGVIRSASETEAIAVSVPDTGGVYFVPAFAGLGAPYWNPYARGTIVGLTRGTALAHLVRATLESIAYHTRDVVEAMNADVRSALSTAAAACAMAGPSGAAPAGALGGPALKVDGGAARNGFLCQFQSDILGLPVVRPTTEETTALGCAYAAGLAVGHWKDLDEIRRLWRADRTFQPQMARERRDQLYAGWRNAVRCALSWTVEPGHGRQD